jgi:hypothetical protein
MVQWKPVTEFEGLYEVSDSGSVRSVTRSVTASRGEGNVPRYGKERKLWSDKNGYMCVDLSKNGKVYKCKVHRLVAGAFLPNEKGLPVVNHLNSVRYDNRVGNLEWSTHADNSKHAAETGVFNAAQNPNRSKLLPETVKAVRKAYKEGKSLREISEEFGVTRSNASNIVNHKSWRELV